jgi:hypothetical protein
MSDLKQKARDFTRWRKEQKFTGDLARKAHLVECDKRILATTSSPAIAALAAENEAEFNAMRMANALA